MKRIQKLGDLFYRFPFKLALFPLFLAWMWNCSGTSPKSATEIQSELSAQYFSSTTQLQIQVFYEPGAEPFVGTTAGGVNYWSITQDNLTALFQYRSTPPSLIIPDELTEMTLIPSQNRSAWSADDLVSLENSYASKSSGTNAKLNLFFLKGNFSTSEGLQTSVLGVSLTGTTVIGLFKEVISSTGSSPTGPVPRFVEQSTIVHEIGHAVGLVNNGVPMQTNHQDGEHGAHSTDSTCVMYWENEGRSALIQFVQKFLTSQSRVMWGPEVLKDVQAFSR